MKRTRNAILHHASDNLCGLQGPKTAQASQTHQKESHEDAANTPKDPRDLHNTSKAIAFGLDSLHSDWSGEASTTLQVDSTWKKHTPLWLRAHNEVPDWRAKTAQASHRHPNEAHKEAKDNPKYPRDPHRAAKNDPGTKIMPEMFGKWNQHSPKVIS